MHVEIVDSRIKRERKGLTRRKLAERVGVKPEQIYRVEKGLRSPSLTTLCRYVDELGPVTLLYDGKMYIFDRRNWSEKNEASV